ncbi:hypothetical protein Hanom_Chr14g01256641 [Helianthus anomalus]
MLMMILLVAEGANAASALIYFESSLHLLDGFKHQSRRNLRIVILFEMSFSSLAILVFMKPEFLG